MAVDSRQNLFTSGLVAVAVSGVVSLATLSLADEMMSHPSDGGGATQTYTAPTTDSGQTNPQPSSGTTYGHPMESQPSGTTTAPSGGTTYPSGGTTYPSGGTTYPSGGTTYPSGGTTYPSGGTQPGGTSTSPWPTSGGMQGGGMGGQGGHDVGVGGGQRNYQGNYQGQGGMGEQGGYHGVGVGGGNYQRQGSDQGGYDSQGRGRWEPTPGEGGRGAPSEFDFRRFDQGGPGGSEADMTKMRDEMMQHGKKFQEEMMGQGQEMMRKGMEDMKKGFGEFGSAGGMGRPSFGSEGGMPGGMDGMMQMYKMFSGHGASSGGQTGKQPSFKMPKLGGLPPLNDLEEMAASADAEEQAVKIPAGTLKAVNKLVTKAEKDWQKFDKKFSALEPKLDDINEIEAKRLGALGQGTAKAAATMEHVLSQLGPYADAMSEDENPEFFGLLAKCEEVLDKLSTLLEEEAAYLE